MLMRVLRKVLMFYVSTYKLFSLLLFWQLLLSLLLELLHTSGSSETCLPFAVLKSIFHSIIIITTVIPPHHSLFDFVLLQLISVFSGACTSVTPSQLLQIYTCVCVESAIWTWIKKKWTRVPTASNTQFALMKLSLYGNMGIYLYS